MHGNFVSFAMRLLYGRVIGVLVRNEIGGLDIATVRILAFSVKDFLVQFDIVIIDSIIEGNGDHHGYIFAGQIIRNGGTVF